MARRKKVDGIPTIGMPRVGGLTLVRGAAGCGKTQRLVDGVRELLALGVAGPSVLVLCATPDAADAFAGRLGRTEVRVTYPRRLSMELLAQPAAVALFGHGPRVLLPFEEDVLFEDLKTSGVEVERIEGMLAFFKRSMTEISDDHPDFLMDGDERAVMGRLREGLRLRGAFLKEQLSANAARYLAASGEAARYAHVFVDDWQCLSRASQVVAGLLARESLCAAIDPAGHGQVFEPYPYAAGIDELLGANPQAKTIGLEEFQGSGEIGQAVSALRREAGLQPCLAKPNDGAKPLRGPIGVEVLPDADHEVERAADLVADAIADGLDPGDVYVASPHDTWSARLARALAKRGVASSTACDWADLAQSTSDTSGGAGHLKVLTAALLAGDPGDDAAWRSWCAFDAPLAASDEMTVAAKTASEKDIPLHEALASGGAVAGTRHVRSAYREGVELLAHVKGMGRDALLRTLTDRLCGPGEPVPAMLERLSLGTGPDDGAAAVRACILDKVTCGFGWNPAGENVVEGAPDRKTPAAVRIGGMARMCGLSFKLVVFPGFVNGLFPPHGFFDPTVTPPGNADRAYAGYARELSRALAKATDRAAFTAFAKIPCSQAEQLGVKIDRIGLENRVRTARVSPSVFCRYLGGSASE